MGGEAGISDYGELQVDQLRYMAARHPDDDAYVDLVAGEGLTFAAWDARSNQLARGLATRGIAPGDRVSIYLPNEESLRWIVAYAAVHKAGAIAVPTNTRLSSRELVAILGHAEVSAMLTCDELLSTALEVRDGVPSLRLLVATSATGGEVVAWDDALDADPSDFRIDRTVDDLADIMYTSGTTGLPKGVGVRHRNLSMIPNHEPAWTGDAWVHGAPLFTFAGITFIYNAMKMGMRSLYLARFDATQWLETVEKERPSMAFLVPAMAELLVAHPNYPSADLTSLQAVSIGSAPLSARTLRALQARLPDAAVTNSYGLTEAGPAYVVMPKDEATKRIGSVGKPLPPTEIRIVDDDGRECAAGEVGELLARLPGRQREYYRDPDATAQAWTDDGWLRSGDYAYADEDGFLYIVGRKKDLIIRGGHNIHPSDVETVILEHPAVREAAVAGVPHAVLGEDVAAFVVVRPGEHLTAEELQAFCADRLADYKRPRQVLFLAELPRNATGKVLKRELQATVNQTDERK
jgi:acyl-CoA synthetase (AMP-forming)/AMP-acid ligase II